MAEESVNTIRETSRNLILLNRRKLRDKDADYRRFLNNNLGIDTDTVRNIANKLKTKASISLSELKSLKNALMDDISHIELMLQTNGALRGLVREITGHDVNKQCAATGCCCNLALADSKACLIIAKAAGTYLVANLDSLNTELVLTSAWTLGNLAGSGPKPCEVLTAQGAVSKLLLLLTGNNTEIRDAALYAIERFAHHQADDFKPEYLHKLLEIIPQLDLAATSRLLFILSCHDDFSEYYLTEEYLFKTLHFITENINKPTEHETIMYMFRTLANLRSTEVYDVVLTYFLSNNMAANIRKLLTVDNVSESVLWFLGNAYKVRNKHDFFDSD